jgi:hypothetical protein
MLVATCRKLLPSLLLLLPLGAVSLAQDIDQDSLPTFDSPSSSSTPPPPLDPVSLKLYHRFTNSLSTTLDGDWIERGALTIRLSDEEGEDESVEFTPNVNAWESVEVPDQLASTDPRDFEGLRYEVSIRRPGQESQTFVSIPPVRSVSIFTTQGAPR